MEPKKMGTAAEGVKEQRPSCHAESNTHGCIRRRLLLKSVVTSADTHFHKRKLESAAHVYYSVLNRGTVSLGGSVCKQYSIRH